MSTAHDDKEKSNNGHHQQQHDDEIKQKKQKIEEPYEPKAILLTGGAGFIGSNVLSHLVHNYPDCRFVCLDKLDYCASLKSMDDVIDKPNFKFVKGDICSADLVSFLLLGEKIDTIMHFAAQTHVDNSFGNSFTFTQANVMGTHVLLECAKNSATIKRFIHVSTDEVYGESTLEHNDVPFDEKSALNPSNPYAATKAAAEFLAKSYHIAHRLPVIITRGNNVFGPRQYPEKLIPKFINLMERGKSCTIHGDGRHRRSYIYVSDVARAFETVLKYGEIGHIYNIGTDFEISTLQVARSLLKEYAYDKDEAKWITFVEDRNFNDVRYNINRSKLHELGWKPEVSFEDGLKKTIAWYKSNPNHFGNITSALVPHPRAGSSAAFSLPL